MLNISIYILNSVYCVFFVYLRLNITLPKNQSTRLFIKWLCRKKSHSRLQIINCKDRFFLRLYKDFFLFFLSLEECGGDELNIILCIVLMISFLNNCRMVMFFFNMPVFFFITKMPKNLMGKEDAVYFGKHF